MCACMVMYVCFCCSIHNTLYLEVHCPVVKPDLVVISDNGKTMIDFGEMSIGQSTTRTITFQNISDHTVQVSKQVETVIRGK